MPHSHGYFDRAFKVEALTRAHVQLCRNSTPLYLAEYRQVRALKQVLADQAIDVFVTTARP